MQPENDQLPQPQKPAFQTGCLCLFAIVAGLVAGGAALFALHDFTTRIIVAMAGAAAVLVGVLTLRRFVKAIVKWEAEKDDRFWNWFGQHAAELRAFSPTDMEQAVAAMVRIHAELNKVDRRLTCEIGTEADDLRVLVISAGGIKRMIPFVDDLVDRLGERTFEGWKIVRLKQRKGPSFTKAFVNGEMVEAEGIYFQLHEPDSEGSLPLTVYLDQFGAGDEEGRNAAGHIVFVFLDGLLGERDTAEGLAEINFALPANRPPESLPLLALPEEFDRRRAEARAAKETAPSGDDVSAVTPA